MDFSWTIIFRHAHGVHNVEETSTNSLLYLNTRAKCCQGCVGKLVSHELYLTTCSQSSRFASSEALPGAACYPLSRVHTHFSISLASRSAQGPAGDQRTGERLPSRGTRDATPGPKSRASVTSLQRRREGEGQGAAQSCCRVPGPALRPHSP